MNKETLKRIAKTHKVNLEHFDSVIAYTNEAFTKVHVTFAITEVVCGRKCQYDCKFIKLSIAAILKRGEDYSDYTTQGWTFLDLIK